MRKSATPRLACAQIHLQDQTSHASPVGNDGCSVERSNAVWKGVTQCGKERSSVKRSDAVWATEEGPLLSSHSSTGTALKRSAGSRRADSGHLVGVGDRDASTMQEQRAITVAAKQSWQHLQLPTGPEPAAHHHGPACQQLHPLEMMQIQEVQPCTRAWVCLCTHALAQNIQVQAYS